MRNGTLHRSKGNGKRCTTAERTQKLFECNLTVHPDLPFSNALQIFHFCFHYLQPLLGPCYPCPASKMHLIP